MSRKPIRWWGQPFWQTAEQEDQLLLSRVNQLVMAGLCALLLASGQPLLALCGAGLLLCLIWSLADDTTEPGRTYGALRGASALLWRSFSLCLLLLLGFLVLPSLLLATVFPGLLWFAGAVLLAGSAAGALARFFQPLAGHHVSAAAFGIALAIALKSPLLLAGSAVFLLLAAGAWARMSRSDFQALVPGLLRRRPTVLTEPEAPPRDETETPGEVATLADDPFPAGALTFQLSTWIACHLEGRTAEEPERLRQELARPVPDSRLPLCRRILAHAIQFQEGSFVRELVQNVLDEAARTGAGPWRRVLEIECRAAGPHLLEIEVADLLGMSFATVVNDLLIPNRTSKSVRDWGTIGRFGQGFFTTLREAESVRVRSFRRGAAGGGWELDVLLTPVWRGGGLHDVTVSLSALWQERGREEGTTITWRGGGSVPDAREEIHATLRNIPVEELHIWLDDERVNQPSSNYALIPTLLGPLRLAVGDSDRKDLLLTKNGLPLALVSPPRLEELFPDAPERLTDILFAGGVVLDLPPGLPLTRTRNALAAHASFAGSLSRDVVRACMLADIESALRLRPWPSALRKRHAIPRDPCDWSAGSTEARELGERVATGEADLEHLSRFTVFGTSRSELLLSLPCVPQRRSGTRMSLSQVARASWLTLLRSAIPWPSRPLSDAFVSRRKRRGFVRRIVRLARWIYRSISVVAGAACLLLALALPFRFLGHQIGLWAVAAFAIYFLGRLGIDAASRNLLAFTVPIGRIPPDRHLCSVWDALGSMAEGGAALLIDPSSLATPTAHPRCHLYRRVSSVVAFAEKGGGITGEISWNAFFMNQRWDVRHLLRYLRSGGDPAAVEVLRPWLGRFLYLLTHESVHLIERRSSATHDERFYRRQRRFLEEVLRQEDDFMALCEREARRAVRWIWTPALPFLVWRSARRRQWDWVDES